LLGIDGSARPNAKHPVLSKDVSGRPHQFERVFHTVRCDLENSLPEFIADETPLDLINYFMHICAPFPDIIPQEEVEQMIKKQWELLSRYDIIWYLAPGQLPIVEDNRRYTNKSLLAGFDYTIRGMIGDVVDLGKPIIGFIAGVPELEKRVEVVVESTKLWKQMEEARKKMN
jgi:hypothetical protein